MGLGSAFDDATGVPGSSEVYMRPTLRAISVAFRRVRENVLMALDDLAR